MILTAAYALNHALNLFLDIKNIKETLCYVIAAKGEKVKNSPETWHEQLLHIVLDNADKIPYPDDIPKTRKIWGFHGKHKTEAIIWVREDIFEKWLMTIAPTEFDKAKKLLADKELIYYSNRHYKVKRKILGAELNFYGIYLTKPKKRGTRNVSSTKINVSLLE